MSDEPQGETPVDAVLDLVIALVTEAAGEAVPPTLDDLRFAPPELPASGAAERIALAGELLALETLELLVLTAVVLGDLSPELGAVIAAPDAAAAGRTTPRTVARLLAGGGLGVGEGDVLRTFGVDGALRRTRAVELLDVPLHAALADRAVAPAARLVAFVLGAELDEPTGGGRLRRLDPPRLPLGRGAALEQLTDLIALDDGPAVFVEGPDAPGLAAAAAGRGLLVIAALALDDPALCAQATIAAALEGRTVAVDRLEELDEPARRRLPERLAQLPRCVLLGDSLRDLAVLEEVPFVTVHVPAPDPVERRAAWRAGLGGAEPDGLAAISDAYRLPIARIAEAVVDVAVQAEVAGRAPGAAELTASARRASAARLGEMAQSVPTELGWEDLVLAPRPLALLQSLAAFLRTREQVLGEWGFARRAGRAQGLVALFTGESGTGKSLASRILARELGLELFRVDLSTLVSKWIGETEKNLDRIFTAAQGSNAVVFFDEADAVFGARSAVNDARDRYANLEVAYLLQRIESHDGPVVLATNLRGNIDPAFLRRFDAVIEFTFPDVTLRRRLWELLLPDDAPRAGDVDLGFLAERFELSGGGIRNATLTGAVLAADAGGPIGMEHLVRGVAIEFAKLGRLTLAADFEQYHDVVRGLAEG